jgi:hypothetical protein
VVLINSKRSLPLEAAKVTLAQAREHERLRAQGVTVFVVDSVEKGRTAVEFQSVL